MRDRARRGVRLRPLWGFGWAGWAGLVVLGLLVCAAARYGLGVRYQLMVWITELAGIEATYGFVLWVIYTAVFVTAASFSVLTWLLILPALHVSPRRISWMWLGVMLAYAVGWPLSHATGGPHIGSMLPSGYVPAWLTPGASGGEVDVMVEMALIGLVGLVPLVIVTRSWLVAGGCAAAFAIALSRTALDQIWFFQLRAWGWYGFGLGTIAWNLAVLVPLYVWAIRSRREVVPAGACEGCGYDLAGLRGRVCPECGRAFVAVVRGLVAALRRRVRMAVA